MRVDRFFWLTMALAGIVFAAWILGMFITGDLSEMGEAIQWAVIFVLLTRIFGIQDRVNNLENRPAAPTAPAEEDANE